MSTAEVSSASRSCRSASLESHHKRAETQLRDSSPAADNADPEELVCGVHVQDVVAVLVQDGLDDEGRFAQLREILPDASDDGLEALIKNSALLASEVRDKKRRGPRAPSKVCSGTRRFYDP